MSIVADEAARMAKARQEFAEAMARGVSIPELRRLKAAERQTLRQRACSQVTERTADMMDAGAADGHSVDFTRFDAPWMMRD